MAASQRSSVWDAPQVYKHHEQQNVCHTRAKYREGRRPKAVKVYTINLESCFLLVQGVPAIGVMTELVQLFAIYGVIEEYRILDEYPAEQFTEVYLVKFQKLTSARAAKRHTDEKSFYGGILHVCYSPEYETVEDTRKKLQDRRRYINRACTKSEKEHTQVQADKVMNSELPASSSAMLKDRLHPHRNHGETSHSNTCSGFPLLPLPPQKDNPHHMFSSKEFKSQSLHCSSSTEDKMGSLHSFIPSSKEHCEHTSNDPNTPAKEKEWITKKSKNPSTTVPRFIPRTAHLENRKRKIEDSSVLTGAADKNAPLYGPKLPEPPRMDMEDNSLNTTANLIRKTMAKVSSVPTVGKTSTTAKPRRRI
ncbi:RNA-binding protein 48 [Trichomycterus rosablanca]|uniref:RNA-binding protein 48 n=1 Tax=Trichomycterus rosablanca TaxID=2290929 RepID=UPI002F3543E1